MNKIVRSIKKLFIQTINVWNVIDKKNSKEKFFIKQINFILVLFTIYTESVIDFTAFNFKYLAYSILQV